MHGRRQRRKEANPLDEGCVRAPAEGVAMSVVGAVHQPALASEMLYNVLVCLLHIPGKTAESSPYVQVSQHHVHRVSCIQMAGVKAVALYRLDVGPIDMC